MAEQWRWKGRALPSRWLQGGRLPSEAEVPPHLQQLPMQTATACLKSWEALRKPRALPPNQMLQHIHILGGMWEPT